MDPLFSLAETLRGTHGHITSHPNLSLKKSHCRKPQLPTALLQFCGVDVLVLLLSTCDEEKEICSLEKAPCLVGVSFNDVESKGQAFPPHEDNGLPNSTDRLASSRVFSWVPLKHHGQRSNSQELASQHNSDY